MDTPDMNAAIDRVVKCLMESHVAAASKVAWLSPELEPPPELRETIRFALTDIAARMKQPELGRKSKRVKLDRASSAAHELAQALNDPDLAPDLHGPGGLLAPAGTECAISIEGIERIARHARRKRDRIPAGPGNTTMADVEGKAPAQWVCVAAGAWLFESATGRSPRTTDRMFMDIMDNLWVGAGGKEPSESFWDRAVVAVLYPNSKKGEGTAAALLDAKFAIRDAATRGGLLRFEGARAAMGHAGAAPGQLEASPDPAGDTIGKKTPIVSLTDPPPNRAASPPTDCSEVPRAHNLFWLGLRDVRPQRARYRCAA
jgi:hypothetical protein